MLADLHAFIEELPAFVHLGAVFVLGAIPFIESYFGSALGVVSGTPVVFAIAIASLGNIASMVLLVLGGEKLYNSWSSNRKKDGSKSKRTVRFYRIFDKYGIAGVSLLGQTVLPSQITSGLMAATGASKRKIIVWQTVSIIIWGTMFSFLTEAGILLIG